MWSGDQIITEYIEPSGATMPKWSKNFIYFGEGLLATEEPNGAGGELVRYYHPDRIGTRLVTNNADTTTVSQSNLPFGTALDASAPGSTRRFTSYDRSGTSLIDYAVNRYYDSRQGRFTQVDPIGMQAVDLLNPQSLNLYADAGNDPVNARDPLGASGFSFSFGGIGFGGGVGGGSSPGSGGGLIGGLINFGLGAFGSLFGGNGQRHIIGSPFFSLPPGQKVLPLPGPTNSTITSSFSQTPDLSGIAPLQRGLQRLTQYMVKVGIPRGGLATSVLVDMIQTALGEIFGNVFFHAGGLNPIEIQFAGEVAAFEKRSFQGRDAAGLDGFLHDGKSPTNNPRPVQLQQNDSGGMNRIRDDAISHEGKMEKAGLRNMALYIKYTKGDVGVWDAHKYIHIDGENLGIQGILKRDTINEITIFFPDGVIRITRGKLSVLSK
jgi:RHS repeat-associated protein